MKDALGIIYTSKDDLSLRELTAHRSIAALPVAGRYRIVDFLLSNMVNSGVRNVGVITQRNYRSLMDHLGAGKEWDLHARNNGLFILPPFINGEKGGEYSCAVPGRSWWCLPTATRYIPLPTSPCSGSTRKPART